VSRCISTADALKQDFLSSKNARFIVEPLRQGAEMATNETDICVLDEISTGNGASPLAAPRRAIQGVRRFLSITSIKKILRCEVLGGAQI
jgi:hypothetical protein